MTHIIPSLFVSDEQTFLDQLHAIEDVVDMAQLDIADGMFVDAVTWADPAIIASIHTRLRFELHLMVQHPIQTIEQWKGVPHIKRVLFHYESNDPIEAVIDVCTEYGWEPSMVLSPDTPIDVITPYADRLFGVMLMGVHPGAQGQSYIPETTGRLQEVRTRFPHLFLELDGGVHMNTLPEILTTHLDAVCPGSAIFSTGIPSEQIQKMKEVIVVS